EPGEVASLLSQEGPAAARSRALPQVEVLRYRYHSRCVLRYILEAPDGSDPQEVIGKMHKSGARAARDAQIQGMLQPQAAACGLIIPKPLRVVQEWGLFLMERVPGTVMKPVVKQAQAPQQLTE